MPSLSFSVIMLDPRTPVNEDFAGRINRHARKSDADHIIRIHFHDFIVRDAPDIK
jgi:hypothetical protein